MIGTGTHPRISPEERAWILNQLEVRSKSLPLAHTLL